MTTRAHLQQPIFGPDTSALLTWATLRIYEADGVTPYKGKIYRGVDTTLTYPNPFVLAPAYVDIWLDEPTRIVIGVTTGLTKVETLTPVLDVHQDADELVTTANSSLKITGDIIVGALLRATGTLTANWSPPGLSPHTHHGVAPGSVRLGPHEPIASRVSGFPGSTSIGVGTPPNPDFFYTWDQLSRRTTYWSDLEGQPWSNWASHIEGIAASDATAAAAFGHSAFALGHGCIALGSSAYAVPGVLSPAVGASIAVGAKTSASARSVVVGGLVSTPTATVYGGSDPQDSVLIGKEAQGLGPRALAIGAASSARLSGVALGAGARNLTNEAISLGQLEIGKDVIDLGARSVVTPGVLSTQSALIGTLKSQVGFFGAALAAQPRVAQQEVGSGIPALDSLILALRDLGILGSRTAPIAAYDAESLLAVLAPKDQMASWPDDGGGHPAVSRGTGVIFNKPAPVFNYRPYLTLTSSTRLETNGAAAAITTVFAVASHGSKGMAGAESLLTSAPTDASKPRENVFTAASGQRAPGSLWAGPMSKYERDGLDQTANLRATLDNAAHVYRNTRAGGWAPGTLTIGQILGRAAPGWKGGLAEIIAVDDSWAESDLHSMSTGLAFKYHVRQDDTRLLDPATALLVQGQDTPDEIHVNIDNVWAFQAPSVVSGSVIIPDDITLPTLPTVAVHPRCSGHGFRGILMGLWRLLSATTHWIEVYVLPTPTTALSAQYRVGRFLLDAEGNWSTGQVECGEGYKVARPVLRSNNAPLPYLGVNLTRQVDAAVKVYTRLNGVRTFESLVPLRPDNTWFATVRHQGAIEAELVTITSGTVLADSIRPIPPTTVGQDAASVADLALAAIAFLSLTPEYHFRAQAILERLAAIQAVDGSLPATVLVSNPTSTSGGNLTEPTALAGLAAARYEQVTGDSRYAAFAVKVAQFLLTRTTILGVPVKAAGATEALTTDAVLAYWLWRTLDFTAAADAVAAALGGNILWSESSGRFNRSIDYNPTTSALTVNSVHTLWTDLWTSLYCDSVNDARARRIRTQLGKFKIRGVVAP